jgi:hypothetical protein
MNWHLGFLRINTVFWSFFGLIAITVLVLNMSNITGLGGLAGLAAVLVCHRIMRWVIDGFLG